MFPAKYSHIPVCNAAITDINIYNTFRSDNTYRIIVDHCPTYVAIRAIKLMENHPLFTKEILTNIQKNDLYGGPIKDNFSSQLSYFNLESYDFSPSTLLYFFQALNILDWFSTKKGGKVSIIEIGGGYGGLCRVIMILAPYYSLEVDYAIVDLDEVLKLQEKWLLDIGINNIKFVPYSKLKQAKADLCISIYAIGEFPPSIVDEYIEKVLKFCDHLYIWWNGPEENTYFSDMNTIRTGLDILGADIIIKK